MRIMGKTFLHAQFQPLTLQRCCYIQHGSHQVGALCHLHMLFLSFSTSIPTCCPRNARFFSGLYDFSYIFSSFDLWFCRTVLFLFSMPYLFLLSSIFLLLTVMPHFSTRFAEEWSPLIFNRLAKFVTLRIADGNALFKFNNNVYFNEDSCIRDSHFLRSTLISSNWPPQEACNFFDTVFSPIHQR